MTKGWRRAWMIIGLVIIILLIVNEFTSNPYAEHRAKVKLETYLNEKYPDRSFSVTDGEYDRKKDQYQFEVTNKFKTDETFSFQIENGDDYKIVLDRLKESEYDEEASKRLSLEASAELKKLVEAQIPTVKSVTAAINVPKRTDGKEYASWDPSFEQDNIDAAAKVLMDIDVTGLNDKDMYEISNKVYDILQQENINYSSVTLTGYKVGGETGTKSWDYEYKMEFAKNRKPDVDHLVVMS